MKFAHLGDCHLGGWRFPELQELNMQSFSKALDICIKEKVDMVLIAGDLFDSAYPPIEILKQTFAQFRKLHDAKISCFIIAGSHDYSVSGKTFLDVLEHAGFCVNIFKSEEREDKIMLQPIIHGKYALYGYPGMKSGLEINNLRKIKLQDTPGFFKIFMFHTAITEAIGNLPIDSISISELPKADYYALGHLHVSFNKKNLAYSGPIFPNNFEELEELKCGIFQMVEINEGEIIRNTIQLQIKEVVSLKIEINNSLDATAKIISEIGKFDINGKIVLLKLSGTFSQGKISDLRFGEIEKFAKNKGVYVLIRNISELSGVEESKIEIDEKDMAHVEDIIIKNYFEDHKSKFSDKVPAILKALNIEKQEGEKNKTFEDRLITELKTILNF